MEDLMTSEFADFVASNGQSVSALRDKYKKDSHAWWYLNGHTSPNLQTLAIKVLSQVASSSSSERNWSTYSFIHSVKRNRLAASKAEELVYVHSNLRLLTHKQNEYKDGSTKFWDVDPERTDLDFSAATQSLLSGESDSQCAASASGSEAACGSSTLPTSSNMGGGSDGKDPDDPVVLGDPGGGPTPRDERLKDESGKEQVQTSKIEDNNSIGAQGQQEICVSENTVEGKDHPEKVFSLTDPKGGPNGQTRKWSSLFGVKPKGLV
ncbi:uncharacterized protein LOC131856359 [Cryptomeria japonica]|uniref:uncharacterized protein LOC131856359 n=1 Tax=Cryptomeria japonica TaxID=3369 RepID=UPI0027DA890B|nr:uncharacterized protein LOC131856359 [Cryptomeria japonica]